MTFQSEPGRIFLNDANGQLLAEVTYEALDNNTVDCNHTFVDPSLRGQGVAKQLVVALAEEMRAQHKKIYPTCPYVVELFKRDEQFNDVAATSL